MAANRLNTFRTLRDTYVSEIGRMYDEERTLNGEIEALKAQLAATEAKLASAVKERETTQEQLRGIRAVIRGMEDRQIEETRRREDNTIAANRRIEDAE